MSERLERIKAYIKKGQPKVTGEHFDWSQFKKELLLTYDHSSDTYKVKKQRRKNEP